MQVDDHKTMVMYDSSLARAPAIQEMLEIWKYRDLLGILIANNIKTRYKRSTLGVVWTLLNPLLYTLVLTIAFSNLMRFDVKSYPIYLLTGLVFWNFFAQTTLQAANTLVWGSGLLKRIYIPRTIFAVAVLGNGLINFMFSLIPLAILMLFYHQPFHLVLFLLPVPIIISGFFTLGVAFLVSTLAILFTDIVDLYAIILQAWFFLTPIVYPITILPPVFAAYLRWNPIYLLVDLFRSIIYYDQVPSVSAWIIAGIMALVVFISGWLIFTNKVNDLAYRI